jgi:hypothetical protein
MFLTGVITINLQKNGRVKRASSLLVANDIPRIERSQG